ncbi:aminopeptidase P family N-terminal domain-containing protein [Devosia sp. A8/3-2]|nr:aminopeptidase P family N-terminal domain-containing protein [Devosia sp. A8/3-2]
MAFHRVLGHDYYAKVHADIRKRMAAAGIDLLLLDSNDDVIYTTGFSHYTTERPVVFAISHDGASAAAAQARRKPRGPSEYRGRTHHLFQNSPASIAPSTCSAAPSPT